MQINEKDYIEAAEILKVLGHPIRLCIVKGLMERSKATVTCMQDCLNTPQSTLSQHIGKLKSAGIIEGVRHGKEIDYFVKNERVKKLIEIFFKA